MARFSGSMNMLHVNLIAALIVCLALSELVYSVEDTHEESLDDEGDFEAIPFDDAYDLLNNLDFRPYSPENPDNHTYGVIVDCGSSGTRAHLYEWDSALEYPQLLHYIEPMRDDSRKPLSQKFSPSLSSLADATNAQIETYIKRVLDYIETKIARNLHPFTGIYILATAGMRLLDEAEQDRIMGVLSSYIERNYKFAKVKTSVISGADEGMYQWISVNAKAKRFLGQNTNGRTKTFAVVEMGGASAQVTYQLRPGMENITAALLSRPEASRAYTHQIVEPQLSRHDKPENTYRLHSTTFLGFGSNSAREAYLDLLIHKHKSLDTWDKFVKWTKNLWPSIFQHKKAKPEADREMILEDPCSPTGYLSDDLKKPRDLLESKNPMKILGHLLDEDEPSFSYKVRGTGSYNKCKKFVQEMLSLALTEGLNCKDDEPSCTMDLIGEAFIPFESLDVLGIGDIYYTTNLMLRASGTYNHRTIKKRTRSICDTSYNTLKHRFAYIYENEKLRSRINEECFKAVWVDTFLTKALRMPEDFDMLKTVGQINNDDLEWTLGAVLDKSLAIEEATEEMSEQLKQTEESQFIAESTTQSPSPDNSDETSFVAPVEREEDQ